MQGKMGAAMGIFDRFRRIGKRKVDGDDEMSKMIAKDTVQEEANDNGEQKIDKKLKRMQMQKIGPVEMEIINGNGRKRKMKMNFTYTFVADHHQSDQQSEQQYMILCEHTKAHEAESEKIIIQILPKETNKPLENVGLSAKLTGDSWFLSCIQSKGEEDCFRKGFGTAMMITLFDIIYTESCIKKIEGKFAPEINKSSVKRFYKFFDKYKDGKKEIDYTFDKEKNQIKYEIKNQNRNTP